MPRLDRTANQAVNKFIEAVHRAYPHHKVVTHVENLSGFYVRLYVVGSVFKSLGYQERQTLIWRLIDKTLSLPEALRIMALAVLTPKEYEQEYRSKPRRPN